MAEEVKTEHEPSEFGKHMRSAMRSVRKQWGSLIPDEFWQHRREARREMLLAMRSIVDAAINRLEPEEEKPAAKPGTRRKTKVEVE